MSKTFQIDTVSNIELLLNYCTRFYERRFITREHACAGVPEKFEHLPDDYFESELPHTDGVPSVAHCAGRLHLPANYSGDFIKKETGKSAQDFIHLQLLQMAKDKTFEPGKTLSEVAYEPGFKYPQHVIRFFKHRAGYSPNEYRNLN